jgi:hypothetical protein
MTPKEKAEELVDKFARIDGYEDSIYLSKCEYEKKCALIAVDEVLKEYGTYYKVEVNGKYVSYWQEVKQEIEKL